MQSPSSTSGTPAPGSKFQEDKSPNSWLPWMRILPRHDLFGEKRLANLSEEKSLKVLSPEVFIEKDMCRGI